MLFLSCFTVNCRKGRFWAHYGDKFGNLDSGMQADSTEPLLMVVFFDHKDDKDE